MKKQQSVLSNLEIAAFCSQMAMVLKSGFSAMEGISLLLADAANPEEKAILESMYEEVVASGQLYPALKASGVFPHYMLQMSEIGEETGNLDEVMEALSKYYEREESISQEVKGALTYPLIMVGMMLLVIIVLLTKVMPIFNQVFKQLGREMTGVSKGMLLLGNTISNYAVVLVGIAVLLVFLVLYFTKTKKGRKQLMKLGYHIRFSRELYDKMAACRFAGGMYLTLKSGLNTEHSLEFSEKLIDNPYFAKKVSECKKQLEDGGDLGEAFQQTEVFSGLYARMASIANKSGMMDEIMDKIARQYETEIDAKLSALIAVLEPTLVIVLSIIVGVILLSVMLPLMGIMAGL
ncbi:type II secretion system F family protein [Roseburia sp. 499]|uniref:type II secretion system F family protein n=1 Tax=Roseburia sp. 499 TaxID=1261634 RepID=UPI0009522382|nr:type II secretion system F family protein [Roseburia sp. 499]WVK70079.1 type II secretion system F family protein [Roseburia sp. 499]